MVESRAGVRSVGDAQVWARETFIPRLLSYQRARGEPAPLASRYVPAMTDHAALEVEALLRRHLDGQFAIERELGGGGMSRVFLATERALARKVVIKVLDPVLGHSVNVDRFRREIATSATLQHPQVVPVHGAGGAGDLLYYWMPFVAGESLRARLVREPRLDAAEARRLLLPLARALAYAHREGIVHRDIKPENILLAQGEPMLADFGIAKVTRDERSHGTLTSAGMSVGTATYMAPEQVVADPEIDGRADVYALAAVGFELLAGRPPFTGTPQQVMSAHVVQAVPSLAVLAPSAPPELVEAITRGLAKDRADRPTADAFIRLLEATTAEVRGATPGNAPSATPRVAEASGLERRRRALITACALVAAIAAGAWWATSRDGRTNDAIPVAGAAARAGVAVLPFEFIGPRDHAYIAAGIAEELMGSLTELRGVQVASRTTVRAFADSAFPPAVLGARLGVRAMIEGSVQPVGTMLRVVARLVNAADGATVWSGRVERPIADVMSVQRELGAQAVAALAHHLGLASTTTSAGLGTADAGAYDLFLRARFALDERTMPSLERAVELFMAAAARDSGFARAHAGIAEALALEPLYGPVGFDAVALRIRASAARALALDSLLASPHTSLGLLAKGTGAWTLAERELTRATTLQLDLASAHQSLGELFYTLGRFEESERALQRAARLEPASAPVVAEYAWALILTGQRDSASRVATRAVSQAPRSPFPHYTDAMAHERQGDLTGSVDRLRTAVSFGELPLMIGALARAQQLAGDTAAAAATRRRLVALGDAPGAALARAVAALPQGDRDAVFAGLMRAARDRDPFVFLLPLRTWWFDGVRDDARMLEVARALGLPESAAR